jgi:DNA-binding NtrC family response regulator
VGIVTSRIIDGDLVEVAPDLLFGARMVEGLRPARTLAPSVTPVTFHGETGSGKSSLARAMHRWSGKEGPLVVIRCEGRAPDYSIAAEIQRHLESAAGGRATIVVDNVCDLPPKAQGELARLVDDAPEHAEAPPVRLVATTGVALKQAVAQGLLRPDLAARLSAACFDIPPLRERIEDVPALFLRFLSRFGGGSAPSVEAVLVERLCMHEWPFNVRELEQVARQLMTSSGHEPLLRAELLEPMLGAPGERERRSPLE